MIEMIKESIQFRLEPYWDSNTKQNLDMLVGTVHTKDNRRFYNAIALLSTTQKEAETAYEIIYYSLTHL